MGNDIILVDKNDKQTGTGEKIEVHRQGLLHRAFSIFVWNQKGQLMMQQRAKTKYHTPGLWSNTCCSHPKPGEDIIEAAHRRLQQEMGFTCPLNDEFSIIYYSRFSNNLIEHEYDHVIFGYYNHEPVINPSEVHHWKWISVSDLVRDAELNPHYYTVWFRIILERLQNDNLI